jgi:hypothetical protein
MCSTIRRASNPPPVRCARELGDDLADPVGCSKGWNGRSSSLHHAGPHLRHEGGVERLLPEEDDRKRDSVASWPRVPSSWDTSGVSRFPTASTTSTGVERSTLSARRRSGTARNPKSARVKASESARADCQIGVHREERELRHGQLAGLYQDRQPARARC